MHNDKSDVAKTLTDDTGNIPCVMVNTDITNPVLKLSAGYKNYNYVYIADFNRYYFVNTVETLTAQHCLLRCHTDVLYTAYQNDNLLNHECHIVKNSNEKNSLVKTPEIILNNRIYTDTVNFGGSFNTTYQYVLCTV